MVAVGKAAAPMATALLEMRDLDVVRTLAIGTHASDNLPTSVEWIASSHPYPDARSERAGRRALGFAADVPEGDTLVLLLSGGASALMAAPIDGISLDDKIHTTRVMMSAGANIHALNTVRRHLSRVKGGRLAATCRGAVVTLALSDVIGDDLSAIGSGPGVYDPSTWRDAAAALERWGGELAHRPTVIAEVRRGVAGVIPEGPTPEDLDVTRVRAKVIGGRLDAMEGARAAAADRGYQPIVIHDPVQGEARESAPVWLARVATLIASSARATCVISTGETTVRVTGPGVGGRNLEFALALAVALELQGGAIAAASVGTDGIDGSSGVAGGMVDSTTMGRARALGLGTPQHYLDANDSFAFFEPMGDAVRLGRTDTNVGDLQVLLVDPRPRRDN